MRSFLGLLNRAYCPHLSEEHERLHLWIGHRYHEQPSRAWLADRAVPVDRFELLSPRLPHRIGDALPYQPDHLLLRLRGTEVALRIDFDLFEGLEAVRAGLPRPLLPERALNRLDDFLHALLAHTEPEEREFLIYHAARHETLRVRQSLDGSRFEEIKCLS